MPFDDETPVTSSADYLESPHEAKRKELMRKLEAQGRKDEAMKPGADLKSLQLALLKNRVDDKRQDAAKETQSGKESKSEMGTKTREEELEASIQTADDKPTSAGLVQQGIQDAKAEKTLKQEEVQSEDA